MIRKHGIDGGTRRVGILTFSNTLNYGANLQMTALYQALYGMGCNVEILDYRNREVEIRETPLIYLGGGARQAVKHVITFGFKKKRQSAILRDLRETVTFSEKIGKDAFAEASQRYDAIVVGSDQVWNSDLTGGDETFFLTDVGEGVKKISYAASMGVSLSCFSDSGRVKRSLLEFEGVSVRESSLLPILQEIGCAATAVLDPTLLVEKGWWRDYCRLAHNPFSGGYVFVYTVGDALATLEYARMVGECLSLPVVLLTCSPYDYMKRVKLHAADEVIGTVGLREFVKLICEADYVVTSSFHGLCLSIALEKPYSVRLSGDRRLDSRILDMLDALGLPMRTQGVDPVEAAACDIGYAIVDERLKALRMQSLSWLHDQLYRGDTGTRAVS